MTQLYLFSLGLELLSLGGLTEGRKKEAYFGNCVKQVAHIKLSFLLLLSSAEGN